MALSRLAAEFAAEIKQHDWSDAPYRADRAGHSRQDGTKSLDKPVLTPVETETVRGNVMWVVGHVLGYSDPNFNPLEFAVACDVPWPQGVIKAGLRTQDGQYARPGTWEYDEDQQPA